MLKGEGPQIDLPSIEEDWRKVEADEQVNPESTFERVRSYQPTCTLSNMAWIARSCSAKITVQSKYFSARAFPCRLSTYPSSRSRHKISILLARSTAHPGRASNPLTPSHSVQSSPAQRHLLREYGSCMRSSLMWVVKSACKSSPDCNSCRSPAKLPWGRQELAESMRRGARRRRLHGLKKRCCRCLKTELK